MNNIWNQSSVGGRPYALPKNLYNPIEMRGAYLNQNNEVWKEWGHLMKSLQEEIDQRQNKKEILTALNNILKNPLNLSDEVSLAEIFNQDLKDLGGQELPDFGKFKKVMLDHELLDLICKSLFANLFKIRTSEY